MRKRPRNRELLGCFETVAQDVAIAKMQGNYRGAVREQLRGRFERGIRYFLRNIIQEKDEEIAKLRAELEEARAGDGTHRKEKRRG